MSGYLELVGYRPLDGFDISEPAALELPDALLRAIRGEVDKRSEEDSGLEEHIAEVRQHVPEEHRGEFDELLTEARLTYRIRDERGVYGDIWASGIMRRAVLAAGRRLTSKGRLHDPESSSTQASERCAPCFQVQRHLRPTNWAGEPSTGRHTRPRTAPPFLGPPPPPPPDPSHLPPAAARMMRAVSIALGEVFGSSEAQRTRRMSCVAWRQAAEFTRVPHDVSRDHRSSAASSRGTSLSPSRHRRPSTSCFRCSGPS